MSKICNEEGCKKESIVRCYLPDNDFDSEPDEYYCAKHAQENGYCIGCGIFCAGINSFDFIHPGWCDNCYDQINDDFDDEDDLYEGGRMDDYDDDDDSNDPNDSRNI